MKRKPPINYTSRDFDSINRDLVQYAKRYYPNTYRDFSDAGFGSMMLDTIALTGDILSFYIDYQASEAMMDSAVEYDNVVRHAKNFGYKLQTNPSSFGDVDFYVMVPALPSGIGPNLAYAPTLRRRTEVVSSNGNSYLLLDDVDFSETDRTVTVVARVDDTTGLPTYYAVRSRGRVVSGRLASKNIDVDDFQRFLRLDLGSNKIAEIVNVFDASGNEYFEVEHLSQDVIYRKLFNTNNDSGEVPSIFKPVVVPRRFVVDKTSTTTSIQFGYGTDSTLADIDILDPSNTVLDMFAKDYVSDASFDPTKLIKSDKFGISPSNTTITVIYRENMAENVNSGSGTIKTVITPILKFRNASNLNQNQINYVISTIECNNESPIKGDISIPTTEEIKIRAGSYFSTQKRCVTQNDYKSMVYAMPAEFGSIKRVNIYQDKSSFKRSLNLYVVSEDRTGNLSSTPRTLKLNLVEWISQHKMINDSVDILDARIVNFGIKFRIVSEPSANRYDVLRRAIDKVRQDSEMKKDIGEPILISHYYNIINEVEGVEDVVDVQIMPKSGPEYSSTYFDFSNNISADGRTIRSYENVVFEMKLPNKDIEGSVV